MEHPDVRASAIAEYGKDVRIATNKVSDAIGLMWRRNLLVRYLAPRETNMLVRYAYKWNFSKENLKPTPVPSPALSQKTGVSIVEQNGGVLIEFETFAVFVQP